MKTKYIFIILICCLIMGIQGSMAMEENTTGMYKPITSDVLTNNSELLRINEWGGEDAPDPEKEQATQGDILPVGDNIWPAFLILGIVYASFSALRLRKKEQTRE